MRQTEYGEVLPTEAGRSTERPVSVSTVRQYEGRAGDGAVCLAAIDSRSITLSRTVAGIACRIRLSPGQYTGVSILQRGGGSVVRLVHRDPGLTLDLAGPAEAGPAADQRDGLAALLSLPVVEPPAVRLGQPENRRAVGQQLQRPRFLKRRRAGRVPNGAKLSETEIIARD